MVSETQLANEFERIREQLYHLSLRYLRSHEDAEECVQEAFIKAWKARGSFAGRAKLSTWLFSITASRALERLRERRAKKRSGTVSFKQLSASEETPWIENQPSSVPDAYRLLCDARLADELRSLVAVDESGQVVAALLNAYAGWSGVEIANYYGLTLGGAKAAMFRGRRKLREALREQGRPD